MFDYLQELKAGKPVMFEFTEAVEDAEEELGSFKKTLTRNSITNEPVEERVRPSQGCRHENWAVR